MMPRKKLSRERERGKARWLGPLLLPTYPKLPLIIITEVV